MKKQKIAATAPAMSSLGMALLAALSTHASAQQTPQLPEVVVSSSRVPTGSSALDASQIARQGAYTSDSARLLEDVPGLSLYGAGGVSSLPAINGLADDRLRIKVDGMDLIASCPNHMNSPLSYVVPTQLESIRVYPGVSPVSVGGDSVGGAILVTSQAPVFASESQGLLLNGEVGTSYRSNGDAKTYNLGVLIAGESLSLSYKASSAESSNYKAASDFKSYTSIRPASAVSGANYGSTLDQNEVGSTAYKSRNQLLTLAAKAGQDILEAAVGYQDIPYEMYPNQRMDMLGNTAERYNLRYQGQRDWGLFDIRAYHETVTHHMDFGADKVMYYGAITGTNGVTYPVNGMPMNTDGKTDGLALKTEFEWSNRHLARVGLDWQQYRLNDWWPPSPNCGVGICTGGMAPYPFWNIRDGQRDRQAVFGELESRWNAQWFSQLGLRLEQVSTNTGAAQGYNTGMMYVGSAVSASGGAAAYNASDKHRTDNNLDWSAISRYEPDDQKSFELGLSQKTRSPNLYERYAWSTNAMAMEMVNFVGDGNGYVGNPNLKPEVAHTLSFTSDWHSGDRESQLSVTPFYTHVQDYIDATRNYPGSAASNISATTGFVKLQYVNQEARLYGMNIAGQAPVGANGWGYWSVKTRLNYTSGKNLTTGDNLYNVMPLNVRFSLVQKLEGWENTAELVSVTAKNDVSATRNEVRTPEYSLVNLRSSYTRGRFQMDFGIENLFDKMYYQPLGGAYVGQGFTMSLNREVGTNNASSWGTAVPGMGRSLYVGVNYRF
ncbi:TonB-dependent receptor [Rhodoferax sp. GW822-FHT02A01]|uniref:TonB-dependent receptor plug domain-containing protein n=1 Tax=Rhodoferax sp. GW822-FHT02A01 TaxID=3141537 RepID=UPI00315C9D05